MFRTVSSYCALGVIFLCISTGSARATSPAEVQAGMAAAPVAAQAAEDVAAIGLSTARVLYLPLGVGEVVLSPLPGVTALDGLRHIATGIMAPLKTVSGLLKLPFALVRAQPETPTSSGRPGMMIA